MKCNFSYNHYRQIFKQALADGFVITNFRDFDKVKSASKIIILRHDIDALPERHLKLAKIEQSLGIQATYFIRIHGQYYHLANKKTLGMLRRIKNLGHEIGLHSEARVLAQIFKMDMKDLFISEKKILEELFNIKVVSASEHGDLKHAKNFWQNHFFSKITKSSVGIKHYPQEYRRYYYLSDSLQKWTKECLCQNIDKYNKIQVLIHGEWWGAGAKAAMVKLNREYAKI